MTPVPTVRPFSGLRVLGFCDDPCSPGAAPRVAAEVYRRLAAWGAEVTVVAPGRSGTLRRAEGLAASVRPHVLHANSLHLRSSLIAAVLTRRRSIPLVTTVHCDGGDRRLPGRRAAACVYEQSAGRLILGRSARVVAVTPSVADHLAVLGVARRRIEVVPVGVDHGRFFPAPCAGPTGRPPRLLFVGRVTPGGGAHLFAKALARLRRSGVAFEAEFAGDGPLGTRLARRTGALHLAPGTAEEGECLRRADVLVLPSPAITGTVVLEAMACGTCVVAAEAPGTAGLIRSGENGVLFPAGDVRALAAALGEVVTDAGLRRKLATEARVTSLAYSWESTARGTGRVLAEVAAGRRLQWWCAGATAGGLGQ